MRNLLSILFLTISITSFEFDLKKIDGNPLFIPFSKNLSLADIEKSYQKFAFEKLDYHLTSKGNLPLVLKEIATLESHTLEINKASFDNQANISVLINILLEHESDILSENFEPVKKEIWQLYKDIAKKLSLYNFNGDLSGFFLTEKDISQAVQLFKHKYKLTVVSHDPLVEMLSKQLEQFITSYLPFYELYVSFRIDFPQQVDQLLKQILKMIFYNQIKIDETQVELSVDKIIALMQTAMLVNKSSPQPMTYVFELATEHIFDTINRLSLDPQTPFISSLLKRIFALFTDTHSTEVMLLGKALFLKFFMPKTYMIPNKAYTRFVMRKYFREGLKNECKDAVGPITMAAHGIYIVDLLYTSIQFKKEVLK